MTVEKLTKISLVVAIVVTVAAATLWRATGSDYYTKFEVVEQVETQVDPDDPLADAGFYDGTSTVETVTRPEFRFGLLPTPSGLMDKHVVSVMTFSAPLWMLTAALFLLSRLQKRKSSVHA